MLKEPIVDVVEVIKDNKENKIIMLKMYAIVQIPALTDVIVISFDPLFNPSFQGLHIYDIFPDFTMAFEYIQCLNKEDNVKFNHIAGIAIAGYIEQNYLLLIEKASPIKFQNQEIIYQIHSFKKIPLKKENWKERAITNYNVYDFFYSFNLDILSFHEKKNNKNYNFFHLNQKPFYRLKVNVCPFIINGYIKQEKISDYSEILLICRRSISSKSTSFGMDEDGIIRNQTEIEMIISEHKNDGFELSSFSTTFGDLPFSYKINDVKGQISYEILENSFLDAPKLFFNLLGNRKEKMSNNIFLIDTKQQLQTQQQSQNDDLNVMMQKAFFFLSGVFHIVQIPIDIDTKNSEKEIFDQVYSLLPEIKMRKQFNFEEENIIHNLSYSDQVFYICSNHGNLNAEFVTFLLLCKAFKSIFSDFEDSEKFIFSLISPFLKKYVNSNKTNLPFLKELVEPQSNNATEIEYLPPPKKIERCVSLFPTATIIEPHHVDHRILSFFSTLYFYETPEKPIIINLSEVCRVSRILFMPVNSAKVGNIYKISPSMVSIYGGLYLNQMFPIVENLVIAPTVETQFRVNLKQNNYYSTEIKYAKYGYVRFISFHFQSPFDAFYISNIYVYTDGSKILDFPKSLIGEKFMMLENGYENQYIENEARRIENQESIQLFAFKYLDKIQDLINVDSYFINQYQKKNKEQLNYDVFDSDLYFLGMSRRSKDQFKFFEAMNDNLMKNDLIMVFQKYPFLSNKLRLKLNFMKHYSYYSLYVPFLVLSGPPLFEYVNSRLSDLEKYEFFKPNESIVFLKLVFLQSYSIGSIEIRCNSPLLVEILNSDVKFSNLFLPPGSELPLSFNERVIDIKLIGNPINISFLGFRPKPTKISNEIDHSSYPDNNTGNIIKCRQKNYNIIDSKIDDLNPLTKIIGIKLNVKFFERYIPQFFLFDDKPLYVKMNPGSTFFFPEVISCSSIKIFCKGLDKGQKIYSDAVIIELLENQEIDKNEISLPKIIKQKPKSIQIFNNVFRSSIKSLIGLGIYDS